MGRFLGSGVYPLAKALEQACVYVGFGEFGGKHSHHSEFIDSILRSQRLTFPQFWTDTSALNVTTIPPYPNASIVAQPGFARLALSTTPMLAKEGEI